MTNSGNRDNINTSIAEQKNYKVFTLDEFKNAAHSISKEDRAIIYGKGHFQGYVNSSNARKINGLIRSDKPLPSNYKKIADSLQSVINKNTLPEDLEVVRYVNLDALEAITGVKPPTQSLKKTASQYSNELENTVNSIRQGHVYTEKAFLSTSGVPDKNVMKDKGVQLNIKAPKGTHAYITTNKKESEIIFGQNAQLEISSARIENGQVVLDCVIIQ